MIYSCTAADYSSGESREKFVCGTRFKAIPADEGWIRFIVEQWRGMTKLLVNDTFDPFGAMRVYKYVAIMQPIMPDAGSDDGRILRVREHRQPAGAMLEEVILPMSGRWSLVHRTRQSVSDASNDWTAFVPHVSTACGNCAGEAPINWSPGLDTQTDLFHNILPHVTLVIGSPAFESRPLANINARGKALVGANPTFILYSTFGYPLILVLLADAEKVSNKFRLTAKPGEELSIFTSAQMDTEIAALDNRMRQQAARRQKGASLVKLTGWALYDKDLYTNLIENITGLLDNLERTFPAQEAQGSLTVTEIEELSEEIRDKQASMLKILHDLSAGVDRMMHNEMRDLVAAKKISIGSMEVGENARVRDGNFYSSAWKGETSVPKATGEISMESIRVGESARLMNGDTCRDKDDFWD